MCISGTGGPAPAQMPPGGKPGQVDGGGAAAAPAASTTATGTSVAGAGGDAATGAATLAGGPPGSLQAVIAQLVSSLQALVAALGGSAVSGGGGLGAPPTPGTTGAVPPGPLAGGAIVKLVGVSQSGQQHLVIKDNAQGVYRLEMSTGKDEVLSVNDGGVVKQLRFDATGQNIRAFEAADRESLSIQRSPGDDQGMALIGLLDQMVAGRDRRVASLQRAFQEDQASSGSGNAVDAQRLRMEQDLASRTRALVEKLRPIGATIDQAEGQQVLALLQEANQTGALEPTDLIRVIQQVDGSARGLSASYAAATEPLLVRMEQQQAQLRAQSEQVAQRANETGAIDQGALDGVLAGQQAIERLSAALAANYQLALTNPAAAQSKLAAAASQPTLDGAAAALA